MCVCAFIFEFPAMVRPNLNQNFISAFLVFLFMAWLGTEREREGSTETENNVSAVTVCSEILNMFLKLISFSKQSIKLYHPTFSAALIVRLIVAWIVLLLQTVHPSGWQTAKLPRRSSAPLKWSSSVSWRSGGNACIKRETPWTQGKNMLSGLYKHAHKSFYGSVYY